MSSRGNVDFFIVDRGHWSRSAQAWIEGTLVSFGDQNGALLYTVRLRDSEVITIGVSGLSSDQDVFQSRWVR